MQARQFIWHLLFWLIIMGLGLATIYPYYLDINMALLDRSFFLPVWLVATYVNWWVLMPRLLDRGKNWSYGLILFGMIIVLTIVQRCLCLYWFYPDFFWKNPPDPALLNPFIPGKFLQFGAFIALPVLCSIGIHLLLRWYRESYQAKQILAQQQAAELQYLKAQINPHFLFNTLNSLYGLSLEESKKVPDLILKLSDVLSYALYESQSEHIPLEQEIKLIKNFIALEKERFENRVQVEFQIAPDLDTSIRVAPLLFIPLVENAFKHAVKEATQLIPIHIHLKQEKQHLIFEIKNQMSDVSEKSDSSHQGLGLTNLKRRLQLLYPKRHDLYAKAEEQMFCARLKIDLDE